MEITLWILKGLMAALFLFSGTSKLVFPKDKLLSMGMKGLVNQGEMAIKGIGILEVAGVAGLIFPTWLGILPVLSGVAALGLALTMVVAARIHIQEKLPIASNLVFFVLCLTIAVAEFLR